ncbi:MAG: FCD domain-containing protein, partial [Tabrizicola sp.]
AESLPLLKQGESLFHLALADASHNPMFARAIEDGLADLFLPFAAEVLAPLQSRTIKMHGDLLAALEAADAGAAESAMAALHDSYWQRLRRITAHAA